MNCKLCPVSCGADRPLNKGYCGADGVRIAKFYLHPYEEPCISFDKGSGCVFFCGCSLRCVFCQNYAVSRGTVGKLIDVKQLAAVFKQLEEMGADNINLVNPTHYVREIAEAFEIYRPSLPVVYNSHGYETAESLSIAKCFTDIWLPDLKFIDPKLSKRYTGREDYANFALPAIKEMAQTPAVFEGGKMVKGCIVRHLILPLAAYDSRQIVQFIATLSESTYFSLMSQYTPFGEIDNFKELQRKITQREYDTVLQAVENAGLKNVFLQDKDSAGEGYIPDWDF